MKFLAKIRKEMTSKADEFINKAALNAISGIMRYLGGIYDFNLMGAMTSVIIKLENIKYSSTHTDFSKFGYSELITLLSENGWILGESQGNRIMMGSFAKFTSGYAELGELYDLQSMPDTSTMTEAQKERYYTTPNLGLCLLLFSLYSTIQNDKSTDWLRNMKTEQALILKNNLMGFLTQIREATITQKIVLFRAVCPVGIFNEPLTSLYEIKRIIAQSLNPQIKDSLGSHMMDLLRILSRAH
jgi:hypothetical protein